MTFLAFFALMIITFSDTMEKEIVVYVFVFVGWGHDPTETLRDDSSIDCSKIRHSTTN